MFIEKMILKKKHQLLNCRRECYCAAQAVQHVHVTFCGFPKQSALKAARFPLGTRFAQISCGISPKI